MEKQIVLNNTGEEMKNLLKKHVDKKQKLDQLEHEKFDCYNPATKKFFQKTNRRNLMIATMGRGYKVPNYISFTQMISEGGTKRHKDVRAVTCIMMKPRYIDEAKEEDKTEEVEAMIQKGEDISKLPYKQVPVLDGYKLYNVEEIIGLPDHYYEGRKAPKIKKELPTEDKARELLKAGGSEIGASKYGSGSYEQENDKINLPAKDAKLSQPDFYGKVTKLLAKASMLKKMGRGKPVSKEIEQDSQFILGMTLLQSDINRHLGIPCKLDLPASVAETLINALEKDPGIYLDAAFATSGAMKKLEQNIERIQQRQAELERMEKKREQMEQSKDEGLSR